MIKHKSLVKVFAVLASGVSLVFAEGGHNDKLTHEMSKTSAGMDKKPNGNMGPTLASSFAPLDEFCIHVDVGLLLEQIRISDTDVALKQTGTLSSATPLTTTYSDPYYLQKMKRISWNVDPGLHVELGFDSRVDDWRLNSVFEWLSSKGVSKGAPLIGGAAGQYIPTSVTTPYYNENTAGADFGEMYASIDTDYYMLEVILSRGSYFSEQFSFEPYAGIHGSWMYFDSTERYWDDVSPESLMPATASWLRRSFTRFWGVGPAFGMDGAYHLGSGFSFYSCGDIALLLSQTRITYYLGFVTTEEIPGQERFRDWDDLLTIYMRGIVGLQYDTKLNPYERHLRVRAGFDVRTYLDPYPVFRLEPEQISGDEITDTRLESAPRVQESGDFGMVGFILDVAIDF